jgi:hypothetical protein
MLPHKLLLLTSSGDGDADDANNNNRNRINTNISYHNHNQELIDEYDDNNEKVCVFCLFVCIMADEYILFLSQSIVMMIKHLTTLFLMF